MIHHVKIDRSEDGIVTSIKLDGREVFVTDLTVRDQARKPSTVTFTINAHVNCKGLGEK